MFSENSPDINNGPRLSVLMSADGIRVCYFFLVFGWDKGEGFGGFSFFLEFFSCDLAGCETI